MEGFTRRISDVKNRWCASWDCGIALGTSIQNLQVFEDPVGFGRETEFICSIPYRWHGSDWLRTSDRGLQTLYDSSN